MFLRSSFQLAHVMWPEWGRGWPGFPLLLPPEFRCLAQQALATGFHRFLARFSGRRRSPPYHQKYPPPWAFLVLVLASSFVSIVDACSSRNTPKPRPPEPTQRPNITFPTYQCTPEYATWYCLNGATCFTVKIGDGLLYNCECAVGYVGQRCEYKDPDGSYITLQHKHMLETASIAGGATIAVFLVVILCVVVYVHYRRLAKARRTLGDQVDGRRVSRTPTFGTRWRTKPLHCSASDLPTVVQDRGDMRYQQSQPQPRVELHQVTTLLPHQQHNGS